MSVPSAPPEEQRNEEGHAAAHWSYEGATGPPHWASLSEEYEDCDGEAQSPIDLAGAEPSDALGPLDVSYAATPVEHATGEYVTTFKLEDAGGLTFGDRRYALTEFHFHTPAEHTVEGQSFAAEAHFVHESDGGALAVLAVMIEEGAENPALQRVLSRASGDAREEEIAPGALLPAGRAYYTYTGSLTTPPCTEGVRWVVMQQPVEATRAQLRQLKGEGTNRPVQPLNGRRVAASR